MNLELLSSNNDMAAICECVVRSSSCIVPDTLTSNISVKKHLWKKVLPLIWKYVILWAFWPKLASIHYSAATQRFLEGNDILLVPKDSNPSAVPEDRIKNFTRLKSNLSWSSNRKLPEKTKTSCILRTQHANGWLLNWLSQKWRLLDKN